MLNWYEIHFMLVFIEYPKYKYFSIIACSDESLEDIWNSNYDDYVYDESLIEPCCTHRWTDKMGHNLKAIMKVMRFAIRRGKTLFNLRSLISNKTISEKLLKYPFDIDQKYSAYKQRVLQYDTTSMIHGVLSTMEQK